MDCLLTGFDRQLASYILWAYNAETCPQHGDGWLGESFSWWSMSPVLPLFSNRTVGSKPFKGKVVVPTVGYAPKTPITSSGEMPSFPVGSRVLDAVQVWLF